MPDVQDSIRVLQAKGYKVTQPRKQVLKVLAQAEKPVSPYDIQKILQEKGQHLNHVTIYRILDLFCLLDLAHRVSLLGGFVKCTLAEEEGCHRFVANQAQLQLFILPYNLGIFLRRLCLPKTVNGWSLRSLQVTLIKIGGRIVRPARQITFQLAEVAVPRDLFAAVLEADKQVVPFTGLSTPEGTQADQKDRKSIASFRVESLAGADTRGFLGLRCTGRMSRGLLQGSEMDIDNQVPPIYC